MMSVEKLSKRVENKTLAPDDRLRPDETWTLFVQLSPAGSNVVSGKRDIAS